MTVRTPAERTAGVAATHKADRSHAGCDTGSHANWRVFDHNARARLYARIGAGQERAMPTDCYSGGVLHIVKLNSGDLAFMRVGRLLRLTPAQQKGRRENLQKRQSAG